nr:23 kDa jasmonate-induced protein-like [Ziziphus jujuba var. spinosa]
MALNVFGKPIGNETLKAMPTYQDKELITAVDRAYEALIMKNADNKDVNARKFVESLKKKYGASLVATLCFIYNAAGNRLTFVASHDWEGHIGDCPYPLLLENGQWGAFLHLQTSPPLQPPYIAVRMRVGMLLTGCCLGRMYGTTRTA